MTRTHRSFEVGKNTNLHGIRCHCSNKKTLFKSSTSLQVLTIFFSFIFPFDANWISMIFHDFSVTAKYSAAHFGARKIFLTTHHFIASNCAEREIERTGFYWNVSWLKTMISSTKLKKRKKKEKNTKIKIAFAPCYQRRSRLRR